MGLFGLGSYSWKYLMTVRAQCKYSNSFLLLLSLLRYPQVGIMTGVRPPGDVCLNRAAAVVAAWVLPGWRVILTQNPASQLYSRGQDTAGFVREAGLWRPKAGGEEETPSVLGFDTVNGLKCARRAGFAPCWDLSSLQAGPRRPCHFCRHFWAVTPHGF